MKTQNTTSNTATSYTFTITALQGAPSALRASPTTAANDKSWSIEPGHAFAEEISYGTVIVTAFAFQLMLLGLLAAA